MLATLISSKPSGDLAGELAGADDLAGATLTPPAMRPPKPRPRRDFDCAMEIYCVAPGMKRFCPTCNLVGSAMRLALMMSRAEVPVRAAMLEMVSPRCTV